MKSSPGGPGSGSRGGVRALPLDPARSLVGHRVSGTAMPLPSQTLRITKLVSYTLRSRGRDQVGGPPSRRIVQNPSERLKLPRPPDLR